MGPSLIVIANSPFPDMTRQLHQTRRSILRKLAHCLANKGQSEDSAEARAKSAMRNADEPGASEAPGQSAVESPPRRKRGDS